MLPEDQRTPTKTRHRQRKPPPIRQQVRLLSTKIWSNPSVIPERHRVICVIFSLTSKKGKLTARPRTIATRASSDIKVVRAVEDELIAKGRYRRAGTTLIRCQDKETALALHLTQDVGNLAGLVTLLLMLLVQDGLADLAQKDAAKRLGCNVATVRRLRPTLEAMGFKVDPGRCIGEETIYGHLSLTGVKEVTRSQPKTVTAKGPARALAPLIGKRVRFYDGTHYQRGVVSKAASATTVEVILDDGGVLTTDPNSDACRVYD
jgi:hypothetical protein